MNRAMIDTALYHMARESMRADAPSSGLPQLKRCRNCDDTELMDISYELISRRWIIRCDCGADTGARRTLRAAITTWNKENRA